MPSASSAIKDQAHRLRQLKIRAAQTGAEESQRPHIILVLGTSDMAGVTALATNLAVALARHGQRAAFATTPSRMPPVLLRDKRDDTDSPAATVAWDWQVGPSGLIVAPLADAVFRENRFDKLSCMGSCTDRIILDAGTDFRFAGDFQWHAEDSLLVVTTPDNAAIMDTYADLKQMSGDLAERPMRHWVVVNRSASATESQLVYDRIAHTCRKFLACQPEYAGFVPASHQLDSPAGCSLLALQSPTSDFARAIDLVAAILTTPEVQARSQTASTTQPPATSSQPPATSSQPQATSSQPQNTELEFPDK